MNEIWQTSTQLISFRILPLSSILLAQTSEQTQPDAGLTIFSVPLGFPILNLIMAIAILVGGWVVALIAARLTEGLLNKTDIDNRIASWVTGRGEGSESPPVEKWIASGVFWLVMIFVLVAFLEKLKLTVVSQPLNNFLNQILGFLPKIGGAAILLAFAWLLATLTKVFIIRVLRNFRLDEKLGQQVSTTTTPSQQFALSETLANALYWFIFLLFLPSVLSTLELQGTLQPVQQLLNQILSILPDILAAVLIGATGWLIAQVIRRIVTNLLAATGTDQLGTKLGLNRTGNGQTLSWLIGTIVYVLVLIPTIIAALKALKIDAISNPSIEMLSKILNAIPQIFTAGIILVIAYMVGQFISELATNILTSIGFNNIFYWLGIQSKPVVTESVTSTTSQPETPITESEPSEDSASETPINEQKTVLQITPTETATIPTRTPSEIAGIVLLIIIMLFATVAATDVLKIEALTRIVTGIVQVSGRILGGLVVFAIGLYLANLSFNLISSTGNRQARLLAQTARISIIALVSAMALQQMGIAHDIVNLAFGLLMGAIAVAIALAFGLGGRDIAAEQVREWLASFKDNG